MDRHAFVDSGETMTDAKGRHLRLCDVCLKPKIGTGHDAQAQPAARTPLTARVVRKAPLAREVRMLALALDAVLDAPIDNIGWRVYIRSLDLRKAIPIDRDADSKPIEQIEKPLPPPEDVSNLHYTAPPAPVRARASAATKGIRDDRMREIANRAIADGWIGSRTGSGHYRLTKGGQAIVIGMNVSDNRAWKNAKAKARQLGINVEGL